jgi:hypothetical protein
LPNGNMQNGPGSVSDYPANNRLSNDGGFQEGDEA